MAYFRGLLQNGGLKEKRNLKEEEEKKERRFLISLKCSLIDNKTS